MHKVCEGKFGGCMKLFSWLSQKVNKMINGSDVGGHDAYISGSDSCPWPQDTPHSGKTPQYHLIF